MAANRAQSATCTRGRLALTASAPFAIHKRTMTAGRTFHFIFVEAKYDVVVVVAVMIVSDIVIIVVVIYLMKIACQMTLFYPDMTVVNASTPRRIRTLEARAAARAAATG